MSRTRHKHIVGLDVLRLVAAVLVVAYHFAFWNWTGGQPLALALQGLAPAWGRHLHFGWVGVEIFFVISGFVIAYSASDVQAGVFLRRRALRLAPASWIAATLALAVQQVLYVRPPAEPVLTYVETLLFWPLNAIDGVWWTLGIEIDFYLLVFVLMAVGYRARIEDVMRLVGCLSGLFWVAALTLQSTLAGREGQLGLLHWLVLKAEGNRWLQLLLVQHGCLFALGTMIYGVSIAGLSKARAAWLAGMALACLAEIVGQNGIISRASRIDLSPLPAVVMWSVAMGAFVLSLVCDQALVRRLGGGLVPVRFAGLATYPLYLVHNAVGLGITFALASSLGIGAVYVGIAAAFAAAALIAGVLEPRMRRGLSALLPEPSSGSPPVEAAQVTRIGDR